MNSSETLKVSIFVSGSPLVNNSLNQRVLKTTRQGQDRLDHSRRIAGLATQGLRIEQPVTASRVTPIII